MILSLLLALAQAEPVMANPPRLVSGAVDSGDYPVAALAEDAQGVSRIEIRIQTDGTASSCRIAQSSGHELLDAKACAVTLERTRFAPATDQDGQPMATTVILPIRWVTQARPREEKATR